MPLYRPRQLLDKHAVCDLIQKVSVSFTFVLIANGPELPCYLVVLRVCDRPDARLEFANEEVIPGFGPEVWRLRVMDEIIVEIIRLALL